MKRFWDLASIDPGSDGFTVRLDQRPLRLPGGSSLRVTAEPLARAIAEEWQSAGANGRDVSVAEMPLTRLAGTAQERIASDPWPTIDAIARFGETDLLCYRAERPAELVQRQKRSWQPWLDWAAATFGAPLRVSTGISPIKQHRGSIAALRKAVSAHDAYGLAGLGVAVPALGSVVLGLALAQRRIDAETAHTLGALDELFQAECWGEDEEAARRRGAIGADIEVAARFMALARVEEPA